MALKAILRPLLRMVPLVVAIVLAGAGSRAETLTIAVEDKDYAPYYVWVDGEPTGPCVEIAAGAVRHMGGTVEFVRYPWSRVLRSVEEGKVDAGLCGTRTEERETYSHYPHEPLLDYDATLFARADSELDSSDAAAREGLSFGLVKGYSYAGVDDALEEAGMIRVEATSRESLWEMLARGRVDTVLDSVLPMVADTRRMGLDGEIRALQPSLAETPGYLFFSRKAGHDELAREFSEALEAFKTTPDYMEIRERYGL